MKIDKTAPTTTIDDGPAQYTNATAAALPFSGADGLSGVAGYECRLDDGPTYRRARRRSARAPWRTARTP